MKRADIKTGFLCNNNCIFCVQGEVKKGAGNKSTEEIKKILKESAKDCDRIVFTGGEPTIREDIVFLVKYAKKLGFKVIQIQSNGRMFAYKNFCQKIIKAGANEFALALHGHIPELHNYLTGSQSFLQTVSGIKNLVDFGQNVLINTVITKSNYRHLPEITKLLISLGVKQSQLAFVHAIGEAGNNFKNVVPRMSLVEPYIKKSIKIGNHFGKRIMIEAITPCFLVGLEEHISERIMPRTKIFDLDFVVDDFKKLRIKRGKAKGKECIKCKLNKYCEGPWKEYPEKFGWSEFKPIKK